MNLDSILKRAVELEASDIHIKVGKPPTIRQHRKLKLLNEFSDVSIDNVKTTRIKGTCTCDRSHRFR